MLDTYDVSSENLGYMALLLCILKQKSATESMIIMGINPVRCGNKE